MIEKRIYETPPVCRQEILRYAGVRQADETQEALLDACLREAEAKLVYRVCFGEIDIQKCEEMFPSGALQRTLAGCPKAMIFAATIGTEFDRLIQKYAHISPAKALMLQAIGTERIEALCDAFCDDMGASTSRFSPGYGDFSIEKQAEIFRFLAPEKQIGVFLTEKMVMTPSKSVTAIFGVKAGKIYQKTNKCSRCNNFGCDFRSTL